MINADKCLEKIKKSLNFHTFKFKNNSDINKRYNSDNIRELYEKLVNKIIDKVNGTGKRTNKFLKFISILDQCYKSGKSILEIMDSIRFLRPLFFLWTDSSNRKYYIKKQGPTLSVLNRFSALINTTPKQCLSTLAIRELLQVFYKNYITIGAFRDNFSNFIIEQLEKKEKVRITRKLKFIKLNSSKLFSSSAHIWLAELSDKSKFSIDVISDEYEISYKSELYNCAVSQIYISRLKKLTPNQNDPVLQDIVKENIYNSSYIDDNELFNTDITLGHKAIEILIDIIEQNNSRIEELWKNTIIDIAGDPRISRNNENYRLWWSLIDSHKRNLLISWLSKFDMALFLRLIEEFSEGKDDIERMFPKRKRLLDYIFNNNFIAYTRLFLGTRAIEFINKSYENHKIFYTPVNNDRDAVIFFYKVKNAYIVEGTHNFAMRIFDRIPEKSKLNDYSEFVTKQDFYNLDKLYLNEFGNDIDKIIHHAGGKWIMKFVDILKNKYHVNINEDELLTEEEFLEYQRMTK